MMLLGLALLKVMPVFSSTWLFSSGMRWESVLPGPKQEKGKENLRDSSKCSEMKHSFVIRVVQNSTSIHILMFSTSGLKSCLKHLA